MSHTEEEIQLHLVMFAAALLAIATRADTRVCTELSFQTNPAAVFEARALAQTVVDEAQRLRKESR